MTPDRTHPAAGDAAALYLDLMKRCLTRLLFPERFHELEPRHKAAAASAVALSKALGAVDLALVRRVEVDLELRRIGKDWPAEADTMVGLARLDNIEECARAVVADGIPGDLIETGVWRGGSSIFMRAVLAALGERDRTVWVADSFAGLPPPDPSYPVDRGDRHHLAHELSISLEQVKDNFRRYDLLDEQVRFLEGWFRDTLPDAPIERLAIIRLDGDMYSSTIDALGALYPKLSPGGFVIIDDYALRGARAAVEDYRAEHAIEEPIEQVDWTGAYWRRASS